MKDVTYPELVRELRANQKPVIVVLDSLFHKKKDILAQLALEAGVVPAVVRMGFNPSEKTLDRNFERLSALPGKQVMFTSDYPLAVHWERGFDGYQLVGEAQKEICAKIQKQNDYVRSAPTPEIRLERQQEVMEELSIANPINAMLDENNKIAAELDEKSAKIIADQDEAAFEQLKQDYSTENIFKRLMRRVKGG